jgi:hypothetical protein
LSRYTSRLPTRNTAKPEAAQKMKDLIDSLEKPQKEIEERDRLLESGNAP